MPSPRVFPLLASVAALIALAIPPPARADATGAELTAAFVYNFVLFTEWPEQALPPGEALTICAAGGAASQYDALRQLHGRKASGHALSVAAGLEQPCHVAFYRTGTGATHVQPGTLTVCEGSSTTCGDAMITLLRDGNRVRFDVDARRARRGGLSFSSKLLRLARHVR